MTEKEARVAIKEIEEALHKYVAVEIKKIEDLADKHGITHYFTGLPPFDSYGNSGTYHPTKSDGNWDGSSDWENSSETGWRSSSEDC